MTVHGTEINNTSTLMKILNWLAIASLVYVILLAVGTIGSGFKLASGGKEGAKELFDFATNPFMGLIIGVLATALVQSSSTTTSVIVGLVAGGLPVSMAIPMIMGANIGTTITNTIVALGHVKKKKEFKRAFQAATMHDFFNLFNVLIFLPLELMFGFLEKTSEWLSSALVGTTNVSIKHLNFIKPITKPVIKEVQSWFDALTPMMGGISMSVIGIIGIFFAITFLGKLLKRVMVGRAREIFHNAIGRSGATGIFSGSIMTILVQSSSTTTSLMVPLVGGGVFKPRDVYPFTLGANIGTCVTAILAATAFAGDAAGVFAMQIAIVHLLYNVLGVAIIYGLPFLREWPVRLAGKLAEVATEHKLLVVTYVLGVFFFIPGILTFIVA